MHLVSNFSDFLLIPYELAIFVLPAQIVLHLFHSHAGRRLKSRCLTLDRLDKIGLNLEVDLFLTLLKDLIQVGNNLAVRFRSFLLSVRDWFIALAS